jgi:hypothetical protein
MLWLLRNVAKRVYELALHRPAGWLVPGTCSTVLQGRQQSFPSVAVAFREQGSGLSG